MWSYGSWIYNCLCNQCLSPLMLGVLILFRRGVLDTTICDKVCQWLAAGWWFSLGTPVSSTNKTDHHDIAEILLKVVLNTITLLTNHIFFFYRYNSKMKIVEAIIRVFLFFIGLVMKPILKIIFVLNYAGSYSEKVPAIRNPLCLLSATKLAKMIRNREVSKGR